MRRPKIVCLLGPTASGKTALAMQLVQRYAFDIISVDSAMVYRGMDIGTAKPSLQEQQLAPHCLIDICDPAENYSAGQFCHDAHIEIKRILQQQRMPLLVGGTMLYFNLLQRGFAEFPCADLAVREKIEDAAQQEGWLALHTQLADIDQAAAAQIHPHDRQRIQRALEVYYSTGKTITQLQQMQQWHELPFDVINIVLMSPDRVLVHERIAKRLDHMLALGLVDEVAQLYQRGDLSATLPALRLVGYRQVWAYLAGEYDYDTMHLRALYATRQLAKRQYTWLKRWGSAAIFNSEDLDLTQQVMDYLEANLAG